MNICNDERLCCGCSACQAVCPHSAIVMCENGRGFYRPQVNEEKCVKCGLCKGVCPANNRTGEGLKAGPIKILAYMNTDEERFKSSSGAAFWALARHVLDKGGIVYGACFGGDFRVAHRRCATESEAQACRGSKYSQSFAGVTYGEAYQDLQ